MARLLHPPFPALGFEHIHSCSTKCNNSAKIWNMLESHTAQLLDYLSQFSWIIPKANTWLSTVLYRLYSHTNQILFYKLYSHVELGCPNNSFFLIIIKAIRSHLCSNVLIRLILFYFIFISLIIISEQPTFWCFDKAGSGVMVRLNWCFFSFFYLANHH